MGLIRRACWVALLSISDAGARPPAGRGEGVAIVFSIVSFLVLLLVVRKFLRSPLPAFAQSLRKFLHCCAPDFAQWDFTADWTSGFDFAQIVRGAAEEQTKNSKLWRHCRKHSQPPRDFAILLSRHILVAYPLEQKHQVIRVHRQGLVETTSYKLAVTK